MGTISVQHEPHTIEIDGEHIAYMQADPSVTPEWDKLLTTPYAVGSRGRVELLEALAALGQTPEDTKRLIEADPGGKTVNTLVDGYVEAVTGFPVGQPPTSTKRSKPKSGT